MTTTVSPRKLRIAVVVAITAALALLPAARHPSNTIDLGTLRPGKGTVAAGPPAVTDSVFWEACGSTEKCFEYAVDVEGGGTRLRAILDSPDNADIWGIRLRSPAGRTVEALAVDPSEVEHSNIGTNRWTTEVPPVLDPEPGRWEVLVVPVLVEDGTFRLRLQLDREHPDWPHPKRPNLSPVPAFGFTFTAPVQPARPPFTGNLIAPAPLEVADKRPVSCMVDETTSEGVSRCLRFSLGVANTGDGPLDLRFDRTQVSGTMHQHVRDDDEAHVDGHRYEIHASHAHFHNQDMATTELLRVTSGLERSGSSTKHGLCLDDSVIAEIDESNSDVQYGETSSCEVVDPRADGRMVLTRGWADIYPWYLPGMYVDFGGLGDGQYVLRSTADPSSRIVETDETDNVAYTWIEVRGDTVTTLERGSGDSPWDVHKTVIPPSPWMV